jgi:hypothetical protein
VQHWENNIEPPGKNGRQSRWRRGLYQAIAYRAGSIRQREEWRVRGELVKRVAAGKPPPFAGNPDRNDLVFRRVQRGHHRLGRAQGDIMLIRLATEHHGDS